MHSAQPTIGQTLPPRQWLLGGRAVYIFVASFPILEFGWKPADLERTNVLYSETWK
jgi:hypothetical protein